MKNLSYSSVLGKYTRQDYFILKDSCNFSKCSYENTNIILIYYMAARVSSRKFQKEHLMPFNIYTCESN